MDYIGVLAAIGTIGTAYVAFRTLKEIKKQRELTYQPDIIIEESILYIKK